MIVTPGIVLTDDELIDAEKLNQLGKPTVTLESGDVDSTILDPSEVSESIGVAAENYLQNGNFAEPLWSRGYTPVICAAGVKTYRADAWWCLSAGGSTTYERATDGPDYKSLMCAKLTGASGVGAVRFGQDVPAHLAAALRRKVTLTFQLYNGTGAAFTPSLELYSVAALNNFTSPTLINTFSPANQAAVAAWTKFTITVDATSYALANGAQVVLLIPSGSLGSTAKSVEIAQVKLEANEQATAFLPDVEERAATATAGTGGTPRNYLLNAILDDALWFATSLTCKNNVDSFPAYGWYVRPGGADTLSAARDVANVPDNIVASVLKLTGGTGVNAVDVGQWVLSGDAEQTTGAMMFSLWLYNNSGAAFTPSARIESCNARNAFDAFTQVGSVPLSECANAGWTLLTFSFTGSDYSNLSNGYRISVRIPDGSLASNTQTVSIGEMRLETGSSVPTFVATPSPIESGITGGTLNFSGSAHGAGTTAVFTADEVLLRAADGRTVLARNVNLTLSISSTGLNALDTGTAAASTWYNVYLISNGLTVGCVAVKELDADHDNVDDITPSWPTGYVYRARVSAIYLDASTQVRQFQQTGREIYQIPVLVKEADPSAGYHLLNYNNSTIVNCIPMRARKAWGNAGLSVNNGSAAESYIEVTDSAAGGIGNQAIHIPATSFSMANFYGCGVWQCAISTVQSLYYRAGTGVGLHRIEITGFSL